MSQKKQQTSLEIIQEHMDEMDSLQKSLKEKREKLDEEIGYLLSDELTKGIQIGSLLIPNMLAIIDTVEYVCRDFDRNQNVKNVQGKKISQYLTELVHLCQDIQSDLEDDLLGLQSKDTFKKKWDTESSELLEPVTEEFRRLAREQNLPDLIAELWGCAKSNVLGKQSRVA